MSLKKQKIDFGTKELQRKRNNFSTLDPLSKLKRFGLITEDEFEIGNWYRFLYIIKYRNPFPSSVNFNQISSVKNISLNGITLKQRIVYEGLFNKISKKLNNEKIKNSNVKPVSLLRDICVFSAGLEKIIVTGKANNSVMVNFKVLNNLKSSLDIIKKQMFL